MNWRSYLAGFATSYLGAGACFALLLAKIPATTPLAVTLMVFLWPTHIVAVGFETNAPLAWIAAVDGWSNVSAADGEGR